MALELPMDAANDVSRTGLVELTISELSGRVGATIDHTLEIVSVDGLSLRAQHLDWLCWASEHRVDVRLPAGKWSLWLHPHGTEEVTLAAQVDVSPGVTTRVTMEDARKQ